MQTLITRILFLATAAISLAACDQWPGLGDGDAGFAAGGDHVEDTSGNLGSSCGTSVTCQLGYNCLTQASSGYCSKTCSSDTDCGYGGSCQQVQAWGGMVCLKTCMSDQSCRPGYSCQTAGTAQVCYVGTSQTDGG